MWQEEMLVQRDMTCSSAGLEDGRRGCAGSVRTRVWCMSWTCAGEQGCSAARGWLSGRHPKVRGQALLGPDRSPPAVVLEMEQEKARGAPPGVASAHLLCFQAAPPEASGGRGGMRSVFPRCC